MKSRRKVLKAYVEELVRIGTKSRNKTRKHDAIRALAGMCMLLEINNTPDGGGGQRILPDGVVDILTYRKAA